jgi:hypothetical protein
MKPSKILDDFKFGGVPMKPPPPKMPVREFGIFKLGRNRVFTKRGKVHVHNEDAKCAKRACLIQNEKFFRQDFLFFFNL